MSSKSSSSFVCRMTNVKFLQVTLFIREGGSVNGMYVHIHVRVAIKHIFNESGEREKVLFEKDDKRMYLRSYIVFTL
jgi:hypothetical protein